MKYKVLNVIEILGGVTVNSFIVPPEGDERNLKIIEAEKLFLEKAYQNGFDPNDYYNGDQDILEEGHFEDGSYELFLTWSE